MTGAIFYTIADRSKKCYFDDRNYFSERINEQGENIMGYVNTRITLKNFRDVFNAKKGNLPEDKIRQATIDVMVDTGASTLVINENIFQQLGLDVMGESEITLANDAKETCKVTEPLVINWEDRSTTMSALVIEDAPDFLLGVLPLEGMDLIVDTVNQKLVGAHGNKPVYRV
jgi:clan AA aspartic protease